MPQPTVVSQSLQTALAALPSFSDACLDVACPGALPCGPLLFRGEPEDFIVDEVPAYLPQGSGEHLYVQFEKRNLSTRALMQGLCAQFRLSERDIGYAGQKDERAISRQWLSMPARAVNADAIDIPGARVLEARLHNNKLRLGHLRGNTFTINIAGAVDADALLVRAKLCAHVPNLFGAQRFGHDGATLAQAARFLARGFAAKTRRERFWVSAVQSSLFNAWLAGRVFDGSWRTTIEGDVLHKTDNGAPFYCDDPGVDQARLNDDAVVVTGPLCGANMRPARGTAVTLESRSCAQVGLDAQELCAHPAFDVGARRPASVRPHEVDVRAVTGGASIRFFLPKGSYASVVLRAWLGAGLSDAAFVDGAPEQQTGQDAR